MTTGSRIMQRTRAGAVSFVSSLPGWGVLFTLLVIFSLSLFMVAGTAARLARSLEANIGRPGAIMILFATSLVFAWIAIHAGTLLSRYVFHLFPLRVSGAKRIGCLIWIVLLGPGLILMSKPPSPKALEETPKLFWAFADMTVFCFPLFVAALVFSLSRRYGGRAPHLRLPYLLFLRRFGTFSDREVARAVLSAASGGLTVAFLVSPERRVVSWDPLLSALLAIASSIRLKQPLSISYPLLRSGRRMCGS
jgi:hypothetical protein